MATKAQGNATGLALRFVEYVREELTRRSMSIEALAKAAGMSTNYLATRLRGERLLNLRDFEGIAGAFGLDPQEMLARVEFEPARTYQGRLVPLYGATVSQKKGMEIYRTDDTLPPLRGTTTESDEDSDVSGSDENVESQSQSDYARAAKKRSQNRGEEYYD